MHEMSLCKGVLQVLKDNARTQGYQQVKRVWLEIGGLSGVEAEPMCFSFDVVTRGTLAESARLEVTQVACVAWCRSRKIS